MDTNKLAKLVTLEHRHGAIYAPCPGTTALALREMHEELLGLEWVTHRTARHEYFMSDEPRTYSYGNRGTGEQSYESRPFSDRVDVCRHWLNRNLGTKFNVCFLNKYDSNEQHLGWHADEFPGMDPTEPIVVSSFGAEREIWVKDKRGFKCECEDGTMVLDNVQPWQPGEGPCTECGGTGWVSGGVVPRDQRFLLKEGSLFIMPPGYQDTHLHRIPKHDRPCGWRISLTFRTFYPESVIPPSAP